MGGLLCKLSKWTHWPIRMSLAATFLLHGFHKFGDGVIDTLSQGLGISPSVLTIAALFEVVGGFAVLLGGCCRFAWATRLAGALFSIVMLGAIFTVHWGRWNIMEGGMEFNALILAISLHLLIKGHVCPCKSKESGYCSTEHSHGASQGCCSGHSSCSH